MYPVYLNCDISKGDPLGLYTQKFHWSGLLKSERFPLSVHMCAVSALHRGRESSPFNIISKAWICSRLQVLSLPTSSWVGRRQQVSCGEGGGSQSCPTLMQTNANIFVIREMLSQQGCFVKKNIFLWLNSAHIFNVCLFNTYYHTSAILCIL